jgi:hypothetical protein
MNLLRSQLPVEESVLRAALASYQAALTAHATTEGVAAPWPHYEILRDIVQRGGVFTVVDDITPQILAGNAQVTDARRSVDFRKIRFTDKKVLR